MNKIRMFCFAIAIMFGIFMVVYGGFDDSPGGQLLGLVVIITGIVGLVKKVKDGLGNVSPGK